MAEKSLNKLVDEIGGMTQFELSDFVAALKEKFNISDMMPTMGAASSAAAAPAAQAEEKTEYRVTLENAGSEKIKTIKALRAVVSDLNLTDAKKMVEEAPQVIKESAPKDLAMKIKAELEAAGAKVTLA